MDLKTGDKIKIFNQEDIEKYLTLVKRLGFRASRQGYYVVVGEPYLYTTDYGKQIKTARRNKGMTRTELADAVGVKPKTVFEWEIGRKAPKEWRKVQKILGI